MKRIPIILAASFSLLVTACGSSSSSTNATKTAVPSQQAIGTAAGQAFVKCMSADMPQSMRTDPSMISMERSQYDDLFNMWVTGQSAHVSCHGPAKALPPAARQAANVVYVHFLGRLKRQARQAQRKNAVRVLQSHILKDARKAVTDGLLSGPISSVECQAATSADATDQHQATYSCLAVNKTASDGTMSGYSYTGTINYDDGSLTWHLGRGGTTP